LKVEAERASGMRSLYIKVREAAAAVAKEGKIDYVIINDSIPPIEPAGFTATRQQLAMRRILFADNELDITDAVIARANAEFKSRGGTPPSGITAPQAAPKP
jgi:Skp family chaperone for outer membrane proteins